MILIQNDCTGYMNLYNPQLQLLTNNCRFQLDILSYTEFTKDKIWPYQPNQIWNDIFFILEGNGAMVQNGQIIPITAGKIFFHPSHSQKIDRFYSASIRKIHLRFRMELYYYLDLFQNLNQVITLDDTEQIGQQMMQIALNRQLSSYFQIQPLLHRAIMPLFEMIEQDLQHFIQQGQKYEKLFQYIAHHCTAQLKLPQIAKEIGISVSQMTHTIPAEIGFSIKDFLQQELLVRSRYDLWHTDLSISQIAEKYEFSSPEYFSNWFQKHSGKRPSDYRKSRFTHKKSGSIYEL